MAEDFSAQVEHHHLPGPLHEINLKVFEHKTENEQSYPDGCNLRDANQGPAAQKAIQKCVSAGNWRQVTIDNDLGEIGAQHIRPYFEQNRTQGNSSFPFVGTQIP